MLHWTRFTVISFHYQEHGIFVEFSLVKFVTWLNTVMLLEDGTFIIIVDKYFPLNEYEKVLIVCSQLLDFSAWTYILVGGGRVSLDATLNPAQTSDVD